MDKKKILIVTSTFPRDPQDRVTARFVFDLAEALTATYDVFVLAPGAAGVARREESGNMHIERFNYFFPARWQALSSGEGMIRDVKKNFFALLQVPCYLIAQIAGIRRMVKKYDIAIVNAHWLIPSGLSLALANSKRAFTGCVTVHAADIFALRKARSLGRAVLHFILKRTARVLPVSSYIKTIVDEVNGSTVANQTIIPMGANLNFTNAQSLPGTGADKSLKLLFIGKLIEKKGVAHLLDAISILKQKGINIRAQIVGGGPLEQRLKALAAILGINDRVEFSGWIKNEELPKYFRGNVVLVVPSVFDRKGETEGMPVVIAESLSCGVPVLASRISGIPDVIKDGYNGWLVEPADAAALASRIQAIAMIALDDFRAHARASARDLDYKTIAARYREAIEACSHMTNKGG
ncbi:MAG: glycosyltransferase [Candidatus Omnitrophota bacterium]